MQNGLNDVDFAVQVNFSYPLISRLPKMSKFGKFLDLVNFPWSPPTGNGLWRVECSRDLWCHV